jgi:hypothetical protein
MYLPVIDGLLTHIILDMGCYHIGRQATSFENAFDGHNGKPHLYWFDEPFVHFLFKQEWDHWMACDSNNTTSTPPPNARNTTTYAVLSSEGTDPSTEGPVNDMGSSSATGSINKEDSVCHHWTWQGLLQM